MITCKTYSRHSFCLNTFICKYITHERKIFNNASDLKHIFAYFYLSIDKVPLQDTCYEASYQLPTPPPPPALSEEAPELSEEPEVKESIFSATALLLSIWQRG